jgi:accessory colonization factor AcfC
MRPLPLAFAGLAATSLLALPVAGQVKKKGPSGPTAGLKTVALKAHKTEGNVLSVSAGGMPGG